MACGTSGADFFLVAASGCLGFLGRPCDIVDCAEHPTPWRGICAAARLIGATSRQIKKSASPGCCFEKDQCMSETEKISEKHVTLIETG